VLLQDTYAKYSSYKELEGVCWQVQKKRSLCESSKQELANMFEGFEQQVPLDTVREHAEITCRGKLEASGARFGTGPRTNLAGLEQLTGVSVRSA
jgi:hypothetical protein